MDKVDKKLLQLKYSRITTNIIMVICWGISVGLTIACLRGTLQNPVVTLAAWLIVSMTLNLCTGFYTVVSGVEYQEAATKLAEEKERDNMDNMEIIEALCINFNAVYYVDFLKDEIRFLQIGNRIQQYMGAEYSEKHAYEWYVMAYARKLVYEEYREEFIRELSPDNLREKLKDRDYYTYNYEGDKDGQRNVFRMFAAKINGSENHLVLGFADVDEEVRADLEKSEITKAALLQAQEANSTKDIILDNIASEIIEPVNSIVEIARMLSANEANPPSVRSSGNHILLETENVGIILTDIMEMNRIRNRQFFLKADKTDLNALLDVVENSVKERAKEKKINVTLNREIVHTVVMCDKKRMDSILQHIYNNAIDFSYVGGEITSSITEIQVLNHKAYYDIVIGDNGAGIDESVIDSLFEPDSFDRVCSDKTSNRVIGLSVTKSVIELMGGKFEITSKKHEGTRITVHLCYEIAE